LDPYFKVPSGNMRIEAILLELRPRTAERKVIFAMSPINGDESILPRRLRSSRSAAGALENRGAIC